MGAAAVRVYELSKYWTEMGHNVSVLTTFPNYPHGVLYPGYKISLNKLILCEQLDGIRVIRTITFPTHLRSSLRRGLSYTSFFLSAVFSAFFIKRYDVIIGTSPSLFVGLAGLIISRMKKSRFVFEVRDLWPEVIPAIGIAGENSLSYKIFDKMASYLYEKCSLIVTVTESFKHEMITGRGIPSEKIQIIENAVDTDLFQPCKSKPELTDMPGLKNKFLVSYIGTIGYTHGVEVILRAARVAELRFPNLVFLLIGDGSDKMRLENISREEKLKNVIFLGQKPREAIPIYLNASDISLVLSSKQTIFEKTIFAKVFEPMACGKPIIVGASGETRDLVVKKANAGIDFEPENSQGLIESIAKLYHEPELRRKLGENGRKYIVENYTRKQKAIDYINILEKVCSNCKAN